MVLLLHLTAPASRVAARVARNDGAVVSKSFIVNLFYKCLVRVQCSFFIIVARQSQFYPLFIVYLIFQTPCQDPLPHPPPPPPPYLPIFTVRSASILRQSKSCISEKFSVLTNSKKIYWFMIFNIIKIRLISQKFSIGMSFISRLMHHNCYMARIHSTLFVVCPYDN